MKRLPKKGRLIMVKWRDSSSEGSWTHSPERHTLSVCRTVGYLAHKDDDRVVIAASNDDTGAGAQRMAIPREVITDIRLLKIGKRP